MGLDNQVGQMTIALQSIVKANVQAFIEYQQTLKTMIDANADSIAAQIRSGQGDLKKEMEEMVKTLQDEMKGVEIK